MSNQQRSNIKVPSTNHITIAGRVGNDPDLRYTPSGTAVCNFDIANTRYYKKDGERCEDTCWVSITVWERLAEYCGENLQKGTPVIVEGRLKQETWEDRNDGSKRSRIVIQAVSVSSLTWGDEPDNDRDTDDRPAAAPPPRPRRAAAPPDPPKTDDADDDGVDEDDIPF